MFIVKHTDDGPQGHFETAAEAVSAAAAWSKDGPVFITLPNRMTVGWKILQDALFSGKKDADFA